jgi:hypothetical protein
VRLALSSDPVRRNTRPVGTDHDHWVGDGAVHAPGLYAEPEEIRAFGRVLKQHRARYSSHIRDESHNVF